MAKIWELTAEIIKNDKTYELWAIKFQFELEKQ